MEVTPYLIGGLIGISLIMLALCAIFVNSQNTNKPEFCPYCGSTEKPLLRSETVKAYHHTGMGSEYLGESTRFWKECPECRKELH